MRLALRAWALRRAAPARGLSSQQRETEQERTIREKLLRDPHLEPQEVVVQDTSGGCGDFFFIKVASKNFHGKRTIQQHNMVKEALQVGLFSIQLLSPFNPIEFLFCSFFLSLLAQAG